MRPWLGRESLIRVVELSAVDVDNHLCTTHKYRTHPCPSSLGASPEISQLWKLGLSADHQSFPRISSPSERMVPMTLQLHSSDMLLSSFLSSYLLMDPLSPASSLPTILTSINDRKPFITIPSTSPVLHKWNTRVSSLLQSKNVESRYWGICLAKATIENGGEGIGHAVVWAKLLLNLLNVRCLDF